MRPLGTLRNEKGLVGVWTKESIRVLQAWRTAGGSFLGYKMWDSNHKQRFQCCNLQGAQKEG